MSPCGKVLFSWYVFIWLVIFKDLNGLEVIGRSIHSSSGDRKTADDILPGSIINGDDQNHNDAKEDNEEHIEEDMVEEDGNIQWLVTLNPIMISVFQALKIYHVSPGF